MSNTLTTMLQEGLEGLPSVSNPLFYGSRDFLNAINSKYVRDWGKPQSRKKHPKSHQGLAPLGKQREHGFALICGNYIELYRQREEWVSDAGNFPVQQCLKSPEQRERDQEDARKRSASRAQKQVRRICNTNHMRYMWTLTFAFPCVRNEVQWTCVPLCDQRSYGRVREIWKSFLKRMRRKYSDFRWLVVFELHNSAKTSEEKRETWHCHLATPDFLDWKEVSETWKHGIVRYDDFAKPNTAKRRKGAVQNPGAYLSKYIGKNFAPDNYHRKRYSRSRNTVLPKKISLDEFEENFREVSLEVFRNERRTITENGRLESESITYRIVKKPFNQGASSSRRKAKNGRVKTRWKPGGTTALATSIGVSWCKESQNEIPG